MPTPGRWLLCAALLLGPALPVLAQAPDPLSLQAAEDKEPAGAAGLKLALEGAVGRGERRFTGGSDTLRRLSADLVWSTRLNPRWRFVLSDRLDAIEPDAAESPVNSLRELYLGWQDEDARWAVDAGRINLRQGPALGYNPTDYFRDGALRVATTVNPALVREYRQGSVMLKVQRLWSGGSLSLALSPKLADEPGTSGFSADLGSTNNRHRALLSLNTEWSAKASSQLHLYQERGGRAQLGASVSALLGDATVAYAEGSWGRDRSALDRIRGSQANTSAGRAAAGLTYSTLGKLSITGELHVNGFALDRGERRALAATQPAALGAYLLDSDRRQDLAARRAVLLYAKQTDAGWRNLDLSVLARWNADDHSTLAWVELRRRFSQFDLAVQWLRYRGDFLSEYGSTAYRSSLQLLATAYF